MKIELSLPPAIAQWANDQTNVQEAILDILKAQLSPSYLALQTLKMNAAKLPQGMEFEIPQIIGSGIWAGLDRSTKLSLGKQVKADPAAFGLVFLHKTSANHAVYKKA